MAATYGIPEDAYTPVETSWGAVKMWTEKTERGWAVIQIPACQPNCEPMIFKCKVKDKQVELVQQEGVALRVYVNPDIYEPDVWETPPGSGRIFHVFSPDAPTAPSRPLKRRRISPTTPTAPERLPKRMKAPSELVRLLSADKQEVEPAGPSPSE